MNACARSGALAPNDRGASPVEFVLVGALLTVLTLAVVQLALVVYVRNVVHDAAVEGVHRAALADAELADGVARTHSVIARAVGESFADDVVASTTMSLGVPTVEVTVTTSFPLVGLLGVPRAWEVTGHAPQETFAGQ
ncbi:TadE family protein [Microbacterium sp. YY-01]|uniref:TadE family protein n=1 Tax=Microbacterium sp. YY-01 TaxID=3421634 RepID=UPI003D17617A